LGKENMTGQALTLSVATVALVLVTGLLYFRRVERTVADVV